MAHSSCGALFLLDSHPTKKPFSEWRIRSGRIETARQDLFRVDPYLDAEAEYPPKFDRDRAFTFAKGFGDTRSPDGFHHHGHAAESGEKWNGRCSTNERLTAGLRSCACPLSIQPSERPPGERSWTAARSRRARMAALTCTSPDTPGCKPSNPSRWLDTAA